mmetsp:Transcript_44583/g.81399  ORF Transcript_44583/g.81399 Transcript_44583/m.81399 type:complete len:263 (-) Transcript_44583:20-808(-)
MGFHHLSHDTFLFCIPLRIGVFIYAFLMLILSGTAVLGLFTEDGRVLVGGYGTAGHSEVALLGIIGVIFSIGGLIGVSDNYGSWVYPLCYYSFVYAMLRVILVALDLRQFRECTDMGLAGTHISSVDDLSGYNPALSAVALDGRCHATEGHYLGCTIGVVAFTLYGAATTMRWCAFVTRFPSYPISPDESLAFARYLQKQADIEEEEISKQDADHCEFSDDDQDPEEGGAVMLGDPDDEDDDGADGGGESRPQFQPAPYAVP